MNDNRTYGYGSSFGALSNAEKAFVEFIYLLKENNPEKFHTLFMTNTSPIISLPVRDKLGWWVINSDPDNFNLSKLNLLHFLLRNFEFIDCCYEEIEVHHVGNEMPKGKTVWLADVQTFILLYHTFIIELKIIPEPKSIYELLPLHFSIMNKKTGKAEGLKARNLIASLSLAKQNPVVIEKVKRFVGFLMS